ncbi:hypothetical protein G195_007588 [Phytophthora kernoviae 00238/432]|uniref:Uncharacterized protein n=1 Tax=Phytophthora kernoviae 00238/432 TaxID=1284355 RepID=A0A8J4SDV3_9STRA|nr:hypothetical protein G195_007588 [Phytophthora kernoviae 00238/432]
MFRTPVFTAVDVVMREQDALAGCPHVAEMMSEYLDVSPKWTIERAACAGYMTLLDRLGKRELPISPRELDWALRTAADRGDLRVVQWLTAYRPDMECSTRVMDSAALRGHLHVIKWLHHYRDEGCTTAAMDSAAAYGRLDVVQWLHGNRDEGCTTAAMDSAAAGGHLKMVQWLSANRNEGFTTVASNFALLNSHIEILRWLNEQRAKQLDEEDAAEYAGAAASSTRWIRRERRLSATVLEAPQRRPRRMNVVVRERCGPIASGLVPELIESFLDCSIRWTIQDAACRGYVSLLERLGERKAEINDHSLDWSMRIAATEGYLGVVQWFSAYRPDTKVSTRIMDAAAFRGHLEIVKWLHKNRVEGCSAHAMDSAAAGGHLEVVKWLHDNRTEGCTTSAMDTAAAGGHLTTVQWLWANRTEGCTTVAVDFAIYNGHFPVVKWFSELADFQPRTANHTTENSDRSNNALIKKQPSGQATLAFE